LIAGASQYGYTVLAASIESWHVHVLADHGYDSAATVIGRLKTAMRKAVDRGRIWTAGYDKRFCFDAAALSRRRDYINRHPGARPIPPH